MVKASSDDGAKPVPIIVIGVPGTPLAGLIEITGGGSVASTATIVGVAVGGNGVGFAVGLGVAVSCGVGFAVGEGVGVGTDVGIGTGVGVDGTGERVAGIVV